MKEKSRRNITIKSGCVFTKFRIINLSARVHYNVSDQHFLKLAFCCQDTCAYSFFGEVFKGRVTTDDLELNNKETKKLKSKQNIQGGNEKKEKSRRNITIKSGCVFTKFRMISHSAIEAAIYKKAFAAKVLTIPRMIKLRALMPLSHCPDFSKAYSAVRKDMFPE